MHDVLYLWLASSLAARYRRLGRLRGHLSTGFLDYVLPETPGGFRRRSEISVRTKQASWGIRGKPFAPVGFRISKGIWRQGIASFVRNSYVSTPCPVVICPYLCAPAQLARPCAGVLYHHASPQPSQDIRMTSSASNTNSRGNPI